jgi:hypothetical protein
MKNFLSFEELDTKRQENKENHPIFSFSSLEKSRKHDFFAERNRSLVHRKMKSKKELKFKVATSKCQPHLRNENFRDIQNILNYDFCVFIVNQANHEHDDR